MDPNRDILVKVAAGYNELKALENKQRETTALMIRACLQRIKLPDSRKRLEGIKGLEDLADMLENSNGLR